MAVTIINRDNFEEKVLKADKPVILDLWASWCGPCKMLAPVVEELSEAHPEVLVGKVNVDEEPELADRFGVTAIPMPAQQHTHAIKRNEEGIRKWSI